MRACIDESCFAKDATVYLRMVDLYGKTKIGWHRWKVEGGMYQSDHSAHIASLLTKLSDFSFFLSFFIEKATDTSS